MNKLQQLEEAVNAIPLLHLRAALQNTLNKEDLRMMHAVAVGGWLAVFELTSDESILEPIEKVRNLLR